MVVPELNCCALDSFRLFTVSSPQIEEDPFKCSATAGLLRQRLPEPRLAYPGWTSKQDIEVLDHPLRVGQPAYRRRVHLPRIAVVDVFYAGLGRELRLLQAARECLVLTPRPVAVDQHSEALFEVEAASLGLIELLLIRFRHARQAQRVELVQSSLV
jgi:hypothetical protein